MEKQRLTEYDEPPSYSAPAYISPPQPTAPSTVIYVEVPTEPNCCYCMSTKSALLAYMSIGFVMGMFMVVIGVYQEIVMLGFYSYSIYALWYELPKHLKVSAWLFVLSRGLSLIIIAIYSYRDEYLIIYSVISVLLTWVVFKSMMAFRTWIIHKQSQAIPLPVITSNGRR